MPQRGKKKLITNCCIQAQCRRTHMKAEVNHRTSDVFFTATHVHLHYKVLYIPTVAEVPGWKQPSQNRRRRDVFPTLEFPTKTILKRRSGAKVPTSSWRNRINRSKSCRLWELTFYDQSRKVWDRWHYSEMIPSHRYFLNLLLVLEKGVLCCQM